ncbi:hypothetical protein MHYP_G00105300 [Metynnis hypsauchen]
MFPNPALQQLEQLKDRADVDISDKNRLHNVLLHRPQVCTDVLSFTTRLQYHINTTNQISIRKKEYEMSLEKQKFIEQEISDMLEKNIRPFVSPGASPIVPVSKKDGGIRFCLNYRGFNTKTHLDAYSMPQIQEIFSVIHGPQIISTLDLRRGQVAQQQAEPRPENHPLASEEVEKMLQAEIIKDSTRL